MGDLSGVPRRLDPDRHRWYGPELASAGFRLLGHLDRDLDSRTYGCFDRDHWAWKFRDHPLAMAQSAVYPLALLWRFPLADEALHGSDRLAEWLVGAFTYTLGRQHRNGAFDLVAPNEQDPGSTLGVMHALLEAFALLDGARPTWLEDRFRDSLRRACDFALRRDEGHAFVSNHWALFAVTYLHAARLLNEPRYRTRSEELIARVLAEQSPDGWYQEYGGADPGYESLGILHVADYWRRTRDAAVLQSLTHAVEFFAHCVHPDGSVGGLYGSRRTALYFPAGFEMLAGVDPRAASVARFLRSRLARRNVVTPAQVDARNLPQLVYSYAEACLAEAAGEAEASALPCEALRGVRSFADGGIVAAGGNRYYAVVNASCGGVGRVFDRDAERLVYEDAGYVARMGQRVWASRMGTASATWSIDADHVQCEVPFTEVRQELLTPMRLVLLRLLNLTLFRSPTLGAWLRRRIVRRILGRARIGPLRLRRDLTFDGDAIHVTDRVTLCRPATRAQVRLRRSFTGLHMGSAGYFHPSDLEDFPLTDDELDSDLRHGGAAERRFTIRADSGRPQVADPATAAGRVGEVSR